MQVNPKTEYCPVCNVRLFTTPIPEEYRNHYDPPYFYSKLRGIYDRNLDRTVAYQCPDCNTYFERDYSDD